MNDVASRGAECTARRSVRSKRALGALRGDRFGGPRRRSLPRHLQFERQPRNREGHLIAHGC
jgi:hypothetical protein